MPVVSGEDYTEHLRNMSALRETARQLNESHNKVHPQARELHKRFLPTGQSAEGVQRYFGKDTNWADRILAALFNKEDQDRAASVVDAFWSTSAARVLLLNALQMCRHSDLESCL